MSILAMPDSGSLSKGEPETLAQVIQHAVLMQVV